MTGRTHDLAAFTALVAVWVYFPVPPMSLATLVAVVISNMLGGLAPDIDEPTAIFWRKIRGGWIVASLIAPLLGGHRMITHSLLGLAGIGWVYYKLLVMVQSVVLVDMNSVWWAFMIGFVSHLVMDMVTKEGVPLLFPLPFKFGFPPIRKLRITTGAFMETAIVFPGLIILTGYLIYSHYQRLLEFLHALK